MIRENFQQSDDSSNRLEKAATFYTKGVNKVEEEISPAPTTTTFEKPSYQSDLTKVFEEEEKKKPVLLSSNPDDEGEEVVIIKKKYLVEPYQKSINQKKSNHNIKVRELYTNVDGVSPQEQEKNNVSVWNFDYESHDKIKNNCFQNHTHTKECSYGETNFADPRTISVVEKRIFTLNYPPHMTIQDYANWLYCFVGKEDQLPYQHLKNLEKLKKGFPLIKEEGVTPPPAQHYPPMDANTYFEKMYDPKTQALLIAPPLNSNTSALLGANYQQYSEFSQNFDQYGSSGTIVNPDIAYKKSARDLDNLIIPKNGNDLELEAKYKPYFVKKVEV
jgi:hypothetical protein